MLRKKGGVVKKTFQMKFEKTFNLLSREVSVFLDFSFDVNKKK